MTSPHQPLRVVSWHANDPSWSGYVARRSPPSLFHHPGWGSLIEEVFGHRCHYRMALDGQTVAGVLALVEMKSLLFGHFLVSLPFFNSGGILADHPQAETALADDAAALASRLGVRHVELRQTSPLSIPGSSGGPWTVRQHKVALVVRLGDPEALWNNLSSRLRGKIRKAPKAGASFSVGGPESLSEFYEVFAKNMRDLGTPVYSRRLFEASFRLLDADAVLFLVRQSGRPVAGAVGFRSGDTIELPWICSDYGASASYVNEFLYWSMIEWACSQSLSFLDLGRSSVNSGPYRFKKQWNPEEHPLHWYYWLAPGRPVPELNPNNPKYKLAIRCWRKLPLAAANLLGPWIVRYIP